MARKRVPVVGTRGLHVAQLSPEVRRILRDRAGAAAGREYAPVLAADRAAFGGANRRYRREKQSVQGATGMAQNSLSQALRGLKSSGLEGRYLRQATQELTARQGDVAGSVPFLLSDAAQERGEAIEGARSQLIGDRASMQQSAASKFNSSLDEERNAASSLLKARSEKDESKFDPRALQNANLALKDALTAWHKNIPVEIDGKDVPAQTANPLQTIDDWRSFAKGLTSEYEGFDMVDVMAVIKKSLGARQRELKKAMSDGEWHKSDKVSPFTRKTALAYQTFNAG